MCTVSWSFTSDGEFALCFNRDEQHTRADGLPPRIWPAGFLAPVDPTAGGTWLAVRPDGGILALLNLYREKNMRISGGGSRGTLIPELAGAEQLPTLAALKKIVPRPMNSFRLLSLARDGKGMLFTWDGNVLSHRRMDKKVGMLTSSSWSTAAVISLRSAAFRKFRNDHVEPRLEDLGKFHQSLHARGGGWSICMTRDDARTVSLNTVRLAGCEVEMTHRHRARGGAGFSAVTQSLQLPLTAG